MLRSYCEPQSQHRLSKSNRACQKCIDWIPLNTYQKIQQLKTFCPPDEWLTIHTVDLHTGGEPLRVVVDGFPELVGGSVLEYRRYMQRNYDHLRTTLMFEPRGHADMYGCLLLPPNDPSGDFGVIFLHNEGYSTMCGHAIIALTKLAVSMGWVEAVEGQTQLKIDAPCGRILSYLTVESGEVKDIRFHCVPSFVVDLDLKINTPSLGEITWDLAYGGAFYAYVDMNKHRFAFNLQGESYRRLIEAGKEIKKSIQGSGLEIKHPYEPDLGFLYGVIFTGDALTQDVESRNVCVFADGEVDRSPTGSGVSGRMAICHQRGELGLGESMSIESITGSVFTGKVHELTRFATYDAVIPEVSGNAHIVGMNTLVIDPSDPIQNGFILR